MLFFLVQLTMFHNCIFVIYTIIYFIVRFFTLKYSEMYST